MKERAYMICHILSGVDGKINGPFMAEEETASASGESGQPCLS